uniref:TF-B3 domain-containing protein n=1 Tax=Leersia perrieri TaxID=77586 RepID=A0A0D9Y109_9ORYZ
MEKLHAVCKSYVADYYWLHMDDHEKSFIKFMIGGYKNSMTIPEKFSRNLRGKISGIVKLETRNAQNVLSSEEIEESADSGGVQNSTKPFYCLVTMSSNMTSEQKAVVDALQEDIKPQIPFYITAMHKATMADGSLAISKDYAVKYHLHKNESIRLCHYGGSKTWEINLDINTDGPYALSTGWSEFIKDSKLQEGDICLFEASENEIGMKLTFHPFKGKHRSKTPDRDDIPTTLCIMAFSREYAKKYLPNLDQTIRLQLPGKNTTWETAFEIKRRINKQTRWLVRGWKQFVYDNKLEIGDICLFQLMKDEEVTMTVHIIRKEQDSWFRFLTPINHLQETL